MQNFISYLKAIPTRERGALVSIEATTIPVLRVVILTGSRGTGENSAAAGLAAACAAKPRFRTQINTQWINFIEMIKPKS